MKTVTKREDFTYIVYDEELFRKHHTILNFHLLLLFLITLYILLFKTAEMYNYLWIIFYVLFIISYRLEPYLSKIKIILYEDKIEIKKWKKTKIPSTDYFPSKIRYTDLVSALRAMKLSLHKAKSLEFYNMLN